MTRWQLPDIAQYLGLSHKYVRDDLSKRPNFPKPAIARPGGRIKFWDAEDVVRWAGRRGG